MIDYRLSIITIPTIHWKQKPNKVIKKRDKEKKLEFSDPSRFGRNILLSAVFSPAKIAILDYQGLYAWYT